jgi:hypothetical protein
MGMHIIAGKGNTMGVTMGSGTAFHFEAPVFIGILVGFVLLDLYFSV